MDINQRSNQNLMHLVRTVHDMTITDDIEKNRIAQMNMGKILGTKSKEAVYQEFTLGGVPSELVSVARPHNKKNIIFYCHGGGYITGSLLYARILTTKLALATSLDVISFDYRLAPEYPFPAALDDALSVWEHLMIKGYGSSDIIVAGDSAGGNLALSLGLKLRKLGRFLPRCFVCMSPWTDLTCSGSSYSKKAELDPILTREYIDRARYAYVPDGIYSEPLISPLFGDFHGFPPVYIQVGQNELLYNDSTELHKRLIKQGVNAKIDIFSRMWHVFQMCSFKTANEAVNMAADYILEKI